MRVFAFVSHSLLLLDQYGKQPEAPGRSNWATHPLCSKESANCVCIQNTGDTGTARAAHVACLLRMPRKGSSG